ncbi:MAG: carboxypeptidase M32 [Pseudoruegeria sp.]
MSALDALKSFQRDTSALGEISGRLGWDQETMMPRGAAGQRGDEMAALENVLHGRRTDPRLGEWLSEIDPATLSVVDQSYVRHVQKSYDRNTKVPADLASALARETSVAQGLWAEARGNEDFDAFAPTLSKVVDLRREEAAALADGGDLYDALLNDYEPEATGAELETMFGALRPRLVALREKVLGADNPPAALTGEYPDAQQMELSTELARRFGYDFNTGRIDKAVHPFSSGSGKDVRITTRTALKDPFNCFYSTIHEVGHACYEQGISNDYHLTPLGRGVSMGVHESQSRIYENQLGRGEAFTGWLYDAMKTKFGDFGVANARDFYRTVNRVGAGYIRTEADEVHYNLHVLLRFDLERQIISGDLTVADLSSAWNERFEADFGVAVDKPSNGVLQDVHWSVGLFGYFPTYTLGNVYAGCLFKAMREALPDLDAQLAHGDASAATGWLEENLQQHGGLRSPKDTIANACGFEPNEGPLLDYLDDKFSALYEV